MPRLLPASRSGRPSHKTGTQLRRARRCLCPSQPVLPADQPSSKLCQWHQHQRTTLRLRLDVRGRRFRPSLLCPTLLRTGRFRRHRTTSHRLPLAWGPFARTPPTARLARPLLLLITPRLRLVLLLTFLLLPPHRLLLALNRLPPSLLLCLFPFPLLPPLLQDLHRPPARHKSSLPPPLSHTAGPATPSPARPSRTRAPRPACARAPRT